MDCPHFLAGECRSCTLLEQPYAEQLAGKQRHARDLLDRPGLLWEDPVSCPQTGFRNKAKMVIGGTCDSPLLGILDDAGVVDLSDCPLYPPELTSAFAPLARFITTAALVPYDVGARRGELKYLLVTVNPRGELMVRFVLRSTEALARIRKHLPVLHDELPRLVVASANIQPTHAAVLEGEHEIALTECQQLAMPGGEAGLLLTPRSFFQTNTAVAQELYRTAAQWIREARPTSVWDLYCGVGGFALNAWKVLPREPAGCVVTGVETSAEAVECAQRAAVRMGADGARFRAADAATWAVGQPAPPDLIVVNPPRRGIGPRLATWLDGCAVPAVVYSSCNAESLRRDLALMTHLTPVRAKVLDMFPNTTHYEVVVLLRRQASLG